VERKWAELWKSEPDRIKFLIQAVYDVLSGCLRPKGGYRWHHEHVLKAKADTICSGINDCKRLRPVKTITFVKPTPANRATPSGLLAAAQD